MAADMKILASKHSISLPFFTVKEQRNIKDTEAYPARNARVGASFCFAKKQGGIS